MAQGRMLKKNISTSRRLADLKSDTARLLYTWILPHLDIEGRFSADTYIIKGYIVPRLKHIDEKIVEDCLKEMADNELIILYELDGDKYLEYRKFGDHQNLNPDREAKSQIPPAPTKRRSFTKVEYLHIWENWKKDNMICPICRKKGKFVSGCGIVIDGYIPFQIDHIIPLSKRGTYDLENLRVICQKCNGSKGNIVTQELIQSNQELIKRTPLKLSKDKLSKVNIVFDKFWDLYNYKKGLKSKVIKKWLSLSNDDQKVIMEYLPKYIQSTPDKQYRKHPLTFLNNKSWEDEIISKEKAKQKKPFFQGNPMWWDKNKKEYKVIIDGEFLEFAGEEKDIEWKLV